MGFQEIQKAANTAKILHVLNGKLETLKKLRPNPKYEH